MPEEELETEIDAFYERIHAPFSPVEIIDMVLASIGKEKFVKMLDDNEISNRFFLKEDSE